MPDDPRCTGDVFGPARRPGNGAGGALRRQVQSDLGRTRRRTHGQWDRLRTRRRFGLAAHVARCREGTWRCGRRQARGAREARIESSRLIRALLGKDERGQATARALPRRSGLALPHSRRLREAARLQRMGRLGRTLAVARVCSAGRGGVGTGAARSAACGVTLREARCDGLVMAGERGRQVQRVLHGRLAAAQQAAGERPRRCHPGEAPSGRCAAAAHVRTPIPATVPRRSPAAGRGPSPRARPRRGSPPLTDRAQTSAGPPRRPRVPSR